MRFYVAAGVFDLLCWPPRQYLVGSATCQGYAPLWACVDVSFALRATPSPSVHSSRLIQEAPHPKP